MATLQSALDSNGVANTCGLHNSLNIVEGFILKQQALTALASNDAHDVIMKVKVAGFCEFIQRSKPCE